MSSRAATPRPTMTPDELREQYRESIRAAARRRTEGITIQRDATAEIAQLATDAKDLLSMAEIAELSGFKTRKAVYDLLDRRDGN